MYIDIRYNYIFLNAITLEIFILFIQILIYVIMYNYIQFYLIIYNYL